MSDQLPLFGGAPPAAPAGVWRARRLTDTQAEAAARYVVLALPCPRCTIPCVACSGEEPDPWEACDACGNVRRRAVAAGEACPDQDGLACSERLAAFYGDDDVVSAGFVRWARADGSRPAYDDPFHRVGGMNDARLLALAAARRLLRARRRQVARGAEHYRMQLRARPPEPETWKERLGRRNATWEGAWHEARAWTGGLWIPACRVVRAAPDGLETEVWRSHPHGGRLSGQQDAS